ncbi:LuxR C-terminal-related transcriptional regulator [Variovorax boronicumulans]|uniref:LuxR C-terminal-related transcriptional regulator n=1 Tax=Variovorax boronicumulans TaxID=436515 RepID=UPI0033975945
MTDSSTSILDAQRQLRRRLLDRPPALHANVDERDLAAHLLLYLDDRQACWHIALEWLRRKMGADRVDGGECQPSALLYQASAESLRQDRDVPSMLGTPLAVAWPGIRTALSSKGPVWIPSVEQSVALGERLRSIVRSKGTCSKLAMPLVSERGTFGLVCADWLGLPHAIGSEHIALFQATVERVIVPVLSAALDLQEHRELQISQTQLQPAGEVLTPAEWRVAQLVTLGLSYKEMARRLGRSQSTVDHQLRSIRAKLNVSSTAKLASMLAVPGGRSTLRGLEESN